MGLSDVRPVRYAAGVKARVRIAVMALVGLGLSQPSVGRADAHMLMLTVEASDEDRALAQFADMMLREAAMETPHVTLIEWAPSRATLLATCQTAAIDEACLGAVAARYHADFVLLPYVETHEDQNVHVRHIEARLFDARGGTLGDAACAVLDASADPEVALALVEVLLGALEEDETPDDEAIEVDASEGRSLRGRALPGHVAGTSDPARPTLRAGTHGRGLVPTPSPCDSLSVLAGRTASAICHGERDPAPEALTITDGAGPAGYAALPEGENHFDHEDHGDRIDRMLERVRLSGRFSRGGVRVGAKIAF
jgi:hypothetical protein